jgi:hypothetical protein
VRNPTRLPKVNRNASQRGEIVDLCRAYPTMNIASIFNWFASESLRAAENTTDLSEREVWSYLRGAESRSRR